MARSKNSRMKVYGPPIPNLSLETTRSESSAVIALHTAIKELEDEIENPDSILNRTGAGKKAELGILVKNCAGVLQQLNKLLTKYKSLGTTTKRTWDRLRWGAENLQDIREKLLTHTSSLTLFLTTLGTGSLGRIEKKLDQLIEDVRAGRREETVITFAIGENDPDESETQWGLLKGELVEEGFSKVEIEGHKHWIKARLSELIESGGLNEQPLPEKDTFLAAKEKPAQPPLYSATEEGVSDTVKAPSSVPPKPPDKLDVPKLASSESTREVAEPRKKTYEAWESLRTQKLRPEMTSPVSSDVSKKAAALQPTVEDADEDDEKVKEDIDGIIEEQHSRDDPTSGGHDFETVPKDEGAENDEEDGSVESDASDGTDDTFLASILPTDSISQVGLNERPLESRNRDGSPPPATNQFHKHPGQQVSHAQEQPTNRSSSQVLEAVDENSHFQEPASLLQPSSQAVWKKPAREDPHQSMQTASQPNSTLHRGTISKQPSGSRVTPAQCRERVDDVKFHRPVNCLTDSWSDESDREAHSPGSPLTESPRRDFPPPDTRYYPKSIHEQLYDGVSRDRSESSHRDPRINKPRNIQREEEEHWHRQHPFAPEPSVARTSKPGNAQREEDVFYYRQRPLAPEPVLTKGPSVARTSKPGNVQREEDVFYRRDPATPEPVIVTSRSKMPPRESKPSTSRARSYHDPLGGVHSDFIQIRDPGTGVNFESANQAETGSPIQFSNPESIFSEFLRGQSVGTDGFDDIFKSAAVPSKPQNTHSRRTTPQSQVTVVERPLRLTLEELFHGCHKRMKIKRKVFDYAAGRRRTEEKVLEFDIKPGLRKDSKIKFKGVGDQEDPAGGQQDLHFIVEEVSENSESCHMVHFKSTF